MLSQGTVDSHAARVEALCEGLMSELSESLSEITALTTSYLTKRLEIEDGIVTRSSRNLDALASVESVFLEAVKFSNVYPLFSGFIENLTYQVDEFKAMYDKMREPANLPAVTLGHDEIEMLTTSAANSLAVLEGHVEMVALDIRRLVSRPMGEVSMPALVKVVSEGIQRINRVKPIITDQVFLFFRLVSSLYYGHVDPTRSALRYSYAGRSSDGTRAFCSGLLSSNKTHTFSEILALDNGQVPGVMHNGGGFGCKHFWKIADGTPTISLPIRSKATSSLGSWLRSKLAKLGGAW